jgi:hypothetical protein
VLEVRDVRGDERVFLRIVAARSVIIRAGGTVNSVRRLISWIGDVLLRDLCSG